MIESATIQILSLLDLEGKGMLVLLGVALSQGTSQHKTVIPKFLKGEVLNGEWILFADQGVNYF